MPVSSSRDTGWFRLLDMPKSNRAICLKKNTSCESNGFAILRRSCTERISSAPSGHLKHEVLRPTFFPMLGKSASVFFQSLENSSADFSKSLEERTEARLRRRTADRAVAIRYSIASR